MERVAHQVGVERQAAAVLEAAERTSGIGDLLVTTLAALEEHIGVSDSAFMLALRTSSRAYAGAKHGFPDEAQLSFRLDGRTSVGYLTVMDDAETPHRQRAALDLLVGPLSVLLRARLPRGIAGSLSVREEEVSELVALGLTNREIAAVLHVEEDTVKKHVSHALAKLGQRHRAELAVAWATGSRVDVPLAGPSRTPCGTG